MRLLCLARGKKRLSDPCSGGLNYTKTHGASGVLGIHQGPGSAGAQSADGGPLVGGGDTIKSDNMFKLRWRGPPTPGRSVGEAQ